MFKDMTVGKKISMGFSIILLILVILGALSVIQMSSIKTKSGYLAEDYLPEVVLVSEIERHAREIMYEARGYAFTGRKDYLEKAQKTIKDLFVVFKKAEDLSIKSSKLAKLKAELPEVISSTKQYEELLEKASQLMNENTKAKDDMIVLGAEFMKNINDFTDSQLEAQDEEFSKLAGATKYKERSYKIKVMAQIANDGNTARILAWRAIASNQIELLKEAEKKLNAIPDLIGKIRPLVRNPANIKQIEETSKSAQAYIKSVKELSDNFIELDKMRLAREKAAAEVLEKAVGVSKSSIENSVKIAEEAAFTATSSNVIIIIGLIIAVALGLFMSVVIVRGIVGPLTLAIDKVSQASNEITTASEELSTASQTLAESSNEQASSIEETSASLEELSGMVKNNVASAEKSNELADQVKNVSAKGATAVKDLVVSMEDILASNGKIQELVKVIAEIGDKTAIIDEIVFQTKLLSFNASVEAERAGEHGRGFAVVAQEVGNLAQMSGKAALEISTIVKESISNAEQITAENKKKVEEGNELVKATAQILEEIETNAKTVASSAGQIVEASKDQASGINQINSAMVQLDKATQNNASTSEETASSSEELSAQAVTLNEIVGELLMMITGSKTNNTQTTRTVQAKKTPSLKNKIKSKEPVATSPKKAVEHVEKEPTLASSGSSDKDWDSL